MGEFIEEGLGVPDFILLDEVSENALYENLKLRYDKDTIYTYVSNVVVSVNPYKRIQKYYDEESVRRYAGKYPFENAPHVYSLADTAFRQLVSNKKDQAVIISGESGAGKTEASKIVMRYISAITPTSKAKDMEKIKDQLLESNPVLEAFGNAKTLRNDNSSRFGKYMAIQFNHAGFPVGGKITVYLLEKSRVVTRCGGERSFHIFYMLLKAAPDPLLSELGLKRDPASYRYLSLSECYQVPTWDDAKEWKDVVRAMNTLQFSPAQQKAIWHVVGAVLHLGQVEFKQAGDGAEIVNKDVIKQTAELLGVKPPQLGGALRIRTVEVGGKEIKKPLAFKDAQYARDALAKALYSFVFLFIKDSINNAIENRTLGKQEVTIGLLDIYGFEVLETNSFEQFCINLTNEKLQQIFIELTLKSEQEEYVREGIEWTPVDYFDNAVICNLIEAKPQGIISYMDEMCSLANRTDKDFLEALDKNFGKHAHYESFGTTRDKSIGQTEFRLKHYAGDVQYDTDGMLVKNKDELYRDMTRMMRSSSDETIKALFPPLGDSKKRPETAGTQFRRSVNELIQTLLLCEPHYIRCIKPNDEKRSNHMHEERTRHQIRYLGLVENVRVRRAGFAYRNLYTMFMKRYKMIPKETWPNYSGSDRDGSELIVKHVGIDGATYRLGKTKLFLKNPRDLFTLERMRAEKLPGIVTKLQTQWRGVVARREYKRFRGAVNIQKYFRAWKQRCIFAEKKEEYRQIKAVAILQNNWARVVAKRWFMQDVYAVMKDVRTHPNLGKGLKIGRPKAKALHWVYKSIKEMHVLWRARTMVNRLSPADQAECRLKIQAYDLFHGKKPWDPAMRFTTTNYVAAANLARDAALQATANAGGAGLYGTGDQAMQFATDVLKIDHKSVPMERVFVVTDRHMVKADFKNFKVHKVPVPLASVTGIAVSPHADSFIVIRCAAPERDIVLDVGFMAEDNRLSWLVVKLQNLVHGITGNTPPVTFDETIYYNNTRTEKKPQAPQSSVRFQAYAADAPALQMGGQWPKSCLVKGPKNANVVMYPPAHPALFHPNSASNFSPLSPRSPRTPRHHGKKKSVRR